MIRKQFFGTETGRKLRALLRPGILAGLAAILAAAGSPARAALPQADPSPTPLVIGGAAQAAPLEDDVAWPWKRENPEPKARHLTVSQAALSPKSMGEVSAKSVDAASGITSLGQTGGASFRVAVNNGYAFLGTGYKLTVLNASNPAAPLVSGKTPASWADNVLGIQVKDRYVYVAAGNEGLRIVDASDPANPVEVGFFNTPGYAWDVFVSGNNAFVADGDGGLQIIDVSTPYAPQQKGVLPTPGMAMDVVVSDGKAFVADESDGLRIVDVSKPAQPEAIGDLDTPGRAVGLAVSGNFVYIADDDSGLRVVDASAPAAPKEIGALDTTGNAYAVDINPMTDTAFVADSGNGLRAIDITEKNAPKEVGHFDVAGCWANDVKIDGSYAYMIDTSHGLRVLNITNPGEISQVVLFNSPAPTDVKVLNQVAYMPAGSAGLRVLDVTNPSAPQENGYFDTPGYAYAVDVYSPNGSGKIYAAVADWDRGLRIIDATQSSAPFEAGSLDTTGIARDVVVRYPYAFVADDQRGLQIVDLGDPASPRLVGSCDQADCLPAGGSARGLVVTSPAGTNLLYAYVADGDKGLQLLDVTDAAKPVLLGAYDTPGTANDVSLSTTNPYAYVADGFSGGLQIVDVSNPSQLVSLGAYDTDGSVNALLSMRAADAAERGGGDYVFIADGQQGLRVVSVEPRTGTRPALQEKGYYNTRGWTGNLAMVGARIFVADGEDSVRILEASPNWVPHVVSGTVTDDQGRPLVGALVGDQSGLFTYTDASGAYSLSGLPSQDVTISVSMDGYFFAPASSTIHLDADVFDHDFSGTQAIGHGNTLSGSVVDENGSPIPGVHMALMKGAEDMEATGGQEIILTDDGGQYDLSVLGEGSYILKPEKAGYAFIPQTLNVNLTRSENGSAVIVEGGVVDVVGTTAQVSGFVGDAQGTPLAGVLFSGDCGVQALSGPDGRYSLGGLPSGGCALMPSLPGYRFSPASRQIDGVQALNDQDFSGQKSTGVLSGQVFDEDGNPVPGVQVLSDCALEGSTDGRGQFQLFEADKISGACKITLQKEGFIFVPANWIVNSSQGLASLEGGTPPVKRFRAVERRIGGSVLDEQGQPVSGVLLTLNNGTSVKTDTDGRYVFSVADTETYTIKPKLSGWTFSPATVAASAADRQERNFIAAGKGVSVRGTVTDEAGLPLAGVTIRSEKSAGGAVTDAKGRYTLWLEGGATVIEPVMEGMYFSPARLEINLPPALTEQNFQAVSTPPGIQGKVTDENGAPLSGVVISDGSGRSVTTDVTGAYSWSEVEDNIQLKASKEGYDFEPASLDLALPASAGVLYDFGGKLREVALTGKVVTEDGLPLAGVSLTSNTGKQVVSDANGVYAMLASPGTLLITPQMEGYKFIPPAVEVTVIADQALDPALISFNAESIKYTVKGRVEEQDGTPLPDAILSENGTEVGRTDAGGNYAIIAKSGDYSFTLDKEGYNFTPADVNVHLPAQGTEGNANAALVSASPLCPNAILNGSFERDDGWTFSEGRPSAVAVNALETAYRGGRVGGLEASAEGKPTTGHHYLRQKVSIPRDATSAVLRFSLYPFSEKGVDMSGDAQLVLILDQNQKEKERPVNLHSDERQWKSYKVDLTRYAGQTIWIYFGTYNNGKNGVAGLYVDDVSLQICE